MALEILNSQAHPCFKSCKEFILLLGLYRSLIRSKLEYEYIAYSSAPQATLKLYK